MFWAQSKEDLQLFSGDEAVRELGSRAPTLYTLLKWRIDGKRHQRPQTARKTHRIHSLGGYPGYPTFTYSFTCILTLSSIYKQARRGRGRRGKRRRMRGEEREGEGRGGYTTQTQTNTHTHLVQSCVTAAKNRSHVPKKGKQDKCRTLAVLGTWYACMNSQSSLASEPVGAYYTLNHTFQFPDWFPSLGWAFVSLLVTPMESSAAHLTGTLSNLMVQ